MDLTGCFGARVLLFCLALTGLAIAGYFTALCYGTIARDSARIPRFCRLGEATCARVLDSPRARVFGVPNSLLGIFYYLAVMALALGGGAPGWLASGYRLVALGTVALGVFLSASLLFITRLPCSLCFTAHGINLGIALLVWLAPGAGPG